MPLDRKGCIVVLPGLDGTGELLTGFVRPVSRWADVHVIAYPLDQPLRYDELVAFVAARLPDGPFAIVAESFSGPIAIEIAATVHRTQALVLASTFASHPLPKFLAPLARMIDIEWLPSGVIAACLLGGTVSAELKTRLRNVLATLPREITRIRAYDVLRVDKRELLHRIECPILCLHGRFDRLVGKRHVKAITSARPACHVTWFDAPHMLLETHPDATAETIKRFLRQE